jgi:hypothetical protein
MKNRIDPCAQQPHGYYRRYPGKYAFRPSIPHGKTITLRVAGDYLVAERRLRLSSARSQHLVCAGMAPGGCDLRAAAEDTAGRTHPVCMTNGLR